MLIDGICNICSHVVAFTVKNDPKNSIQFAALQSPAGQKLLAQYKLPTADFKSFVLIENDTAYTQSTGALRYFRKLKKPWSYLYFFIVIPRPLRDFIYNIVATNRYRWFGKMETCLVPSAELKSRFLED
jgi:predicted DCC family thiol-disulfide oxidoreductase YuxK